MHKYIYIYIYLFIYFYCIFAGSVGGSSLESAGILMYSSKPNESSEFLSSLVCSLKTPGAAPPSAAAEALQLMHAAGRAAEQQQPQWLRFFFNPHTPLLSNGVLPLRRDFLHRISGEDTPGVCTPQHCRTLLFFFFSDSSGCTASSCCCCCCC